MWLEQVALQTGVNEEGIKMFLIHISGQGTALKNGTINGPCMKIR